MVLDALGLVAFTLIGCMTALEMGQGLMVASVSGVITGVFGGVLRDIFCNDIPWYSAVNSMPASPSPPPGASWVAPTGSYPASRRF